MTRTTSPASNTLRGALAVLSARLVLQQIGLALLVFLLYVVWLRTPDASVLDVIASVLLGLVVFAAAGAGESAIILHLTCTARTPLRLLRGAILLLAAVALWLAWGILLDHLHGDDYLRAGYLNSRFPHSMRNFFSFGHIVTWLGWMWSALEWIGAGIIALFAFCAIASRHPARAISRALRSLTYWIAVLLGTTFAIVFTGSLMQWTPGRSLRVELLSLVLRLSLAVFADALVVCILLAILAACVRQVHPIHSTPAGTPDESQPRTVENS